MKHNKTIAIIGLALAILTTVAKGGNPELPLDLGSAGNFVILGKSGISTVPYSDITGDMGVSPIDSTAITGFALSMDSSTTFSTSAQVTGKIYASDYGGMTPGTMTTAISDMETAYTQAALRTIPDATELMFGDISGLTITPGLYKWSTGVLINTDVWLDAEGNPDAVFIFQIAGDLTMASAQNVILTGGAQAKNIFWQVAGGAGAVIGTYSHFEGVILTAKKIDLLTGASFNGKLLAQTAVNLDGNAIMDSSLITSNALVSLEIISEHGIGNPTTGLYFNVSGTLLTNSISATETLLGGTQYVNIGWNMTSNSPLFGITNSMEMTHTNNAVLTWLWSTNYFLTLTAFNGVITNAVEGWKTNQSSQILYPEADFGYAFDHWEVNGTNLGSGVTLNLTMNEAKNVVAFFNAPVVTNFTLEIRSEHGVASPTIGLYTHASGTLLTNSVSASETLPGGTQYVNKGWTMIGNSPISGLTNSMQMTLTNNAVLTWLWTTNYYSSGGGGCVPGEPEEPGPCAIIYNLSMTLKTTAGKSGTVKTSDCMPAQSVCYRVSASKSLKGILANCNCECEAFTEAQLYLWDSKTGLVYADAESLEWTLLGLIGKKNAEVEAAWSLGDVFVAKGFGRYDTKNNRVSSISGSVFARLPAPTCSIDCAPGTLAIPYDLCTVAPITNPGDTIAYGTWTLKYNSSASKRYAADANYLNKLLPVTVAD